MGDRSAAGVQNVVEPFGEHRGGLFDTALDDLHYPPIEVARYQLGDHRRGRRSRLRRLEDRRVAGREGTDERGQRQVQRIVPRRHDQDDTEWLADDAGVAGAQGEWNAHPNRLHPRAEVLEGVFDLTDDEGRLGGERLDGGLAEVGGEGGADSLVVLLEQPLELAQLSDPSLFALHQTSSGGVA